MDCQYQYVPINPSDRYGFLPHHPGDCIDPVVEAGVEEKAPISLPTGRQASTKSQINSNNQNSNLF